MGSCGTGESSIFTWLLFTLLVGVICPQAKSQPGYLNIDCGSDKDYNDSRGRYWETDAKYISTGTNHQNTLDLHYEAFGNDDQIISLRFFNDSKYNKDCYVLPTKAATTYIITTVFYYNNFLHNDQKPVAFSIYLNGSIWIPDSFMYYGPPDFPSVNETQEWDAVVHSNGSVLNLCLVRKTGPSFISAIKLRELPSKGSIYSGAKKGWLNTLSRMACTDKYDPPYLRYPDDVYDRLWLPSIFRYGSYYGNIMDANLTYIQNSTSLTPDAPLPGVLQHAAADYKFQGIFYSKQDSDSGPVMGNMYVTAYFMELDHNASATKVRGIDYYVNDQYAGTLNTSSKAGQVVEITIESNVTENYLEVLFQNASWSKLPAILNAIEIFYVEDYNTSRTGDTDLAIINMLRRKLNLTSWTGDPCIPVPHLWVQCTADIIDPTVLRITNLMLSDMRMSGSFPAEILQLRNLANLSLSNNNFNGSVPDLSNLQQLQYLSLSNNKFTGPIPELNSLKRLQVLSLDNNRFTGPIPNLTNLVHLQTLTLQRNALNGTLPAYLARFPNFTDFQVDYNNFSGTVPSELIDKENSGLHFTYANNRDLHGQNSSSSSFRKIGIIIGTLAAAVASVLVFSLIVWHFSTRKQRTRTRILRKMGINRHLSGILSKSKKHEKRCPIKQLSGSEHVVLLSLEDVYKATKKFSYKIGQGSFGPVFHGTLPDGKEVAVKVNSGFIQGLDQFLNEVFESFTHSIAILKTQVDLLSRIHHRNLVSLVGYCDEAQQEILIYTYLPNGSVCDHLYGNRSHEPLDWKQRLNVALNAARGLEYLHVSCSPRIIHRDVKSSNILLDENWVAKVADFGISRQFDTVAGMGSCITGVETLLKGTPGYIDPDYLDSHKLTQKSDVYSFGVVLLEILSGHHPHVEVLPDGTARTLVQWAHASVKAQSPFDIFDPILCGEFSYDAAIRVFTLAIRCTSRETAERPNMSDVVRELMEAIKADKSCKRVVGQHAVSGAPRDTSRQVGPSGDLEESLTDGKNHFRRITRTLENNSRRITESLTEMENGEENGNLNRYHAPNPVVNSTRTYPISVSNNPDTHGDRTVLRRLPSTGDRTALRSPPSTGDRTALRSLPSTGDEDYFEILPR